MRSLILVALVAAAVASGCGLTRSVVSPHEPPSPAPGEQPINVIPITGRSADTILSLRVFDRSLAIEQVRSATRAELADVDTDLDENTVASYQTIDDDILVTWLGEGCGGNGDFFVEAGVAQIVIVPIDGAPCQANPTIRGVVLEFAPSVDLARINFGIIPRKTAGR